MYVRHRTNPVQANVQAKSTCSGEAAAPRAAVLAAGCEDSQVETPEAGGRPLGNGG